MLLIRHGETEWNREERVQGHTDIPLNAEGVAQAVLTAETLARDHPDIRAVYSSDLIRAHATAMETAKKFHLPVTVRASLREIDTGASEGMTVAEKMALYNDRWKELEKKYPDRRERWNHSVVPGEETINALIKRITDELTAIAKAHPGEKVAVFSHSKVIRTIIADIRDCDWREIMVPNCAIVEITYNPENVSCPFCLKK